MTKTLPLLAAALIAVTGAAHAHPGGRDSGPVTRDEALQKAEDRFAEMDENADGFVTLEELEGQLRGRRARHAEKMFDKHDINDDGYVSLDEMLEHAGERFDEVDTDGDGVISDEEREAAREGMRDRMKKKRG
ncbi:hypothetical protein HK107_13115 [Parvularcula sp. ZS-1/3]|uniref:EF-hand domain-containing protein n=1 Tax=Parvularcula mediterranea TaxID=2732508 RepID=A0A7Y3RP94_9PROT|nr:EF-hand domain-containing protein [Parvularcula mediterranea]NNU17265.1 hypothetical protein [Parvularcula mediterranea]